MGWCSEVHVKLEEVQIGTGRTAGLAEFDKEIRLPCGTDACTVQVRREEAEVALGGGPLKAYGFGRRAGQHGAALISTNLRAGEAGVEHVVRGVVGARPHTKFGIVVEIAAAKRKGITMVRTGSVGGSRNGDAFESSGASVRRS